VAVVSYASTEITSFPSWSESASGASGDGEDHAIVDAVLRLAGGLGLAAIAEGVENAEQVHALMSMGFRLSQGFHFARPQSAGELEQLLEIDALGELAA
jgi:EAL domain-containing protein (putative c-di-GMP-specific phosphodiesterase class I)